MRRAISVFAVMGCLAASLFAQNRTYFSLQKDFLQGRIQAWRCGLALQQNDLKVTYTNQAPWPTATILRPSPSDWSSFDAFVVTIQNLESFPVSVYVRLDDDTSANGTVHCRTGYAWLDSNQTRTFAFPLRLDPNAFGMKGIPAIGGATWLSMNASVVDISHIIRWLVYMNNPSSNRSILISNPHIVRTDQTLNDIVDQFGQYTRGEFPNKVHSEAELDLYDVLDENDLEQTPVPPRRDFLGAFTGVGTLSPTGRFRTQKVGNNWWMVSPYGAPFLSFGMNRVSDADKTIIANRDYMFSWLPIDSDGDPLQQFFGLISDYVHNPPSDGQTYGFYGANLYRKYGADYRAVADDRALRRMRSWGFNTIGEWTPSRVWALHKLPYTVGVEAHGNFSVVTVDPKRVPLPDPFDPQYEASVQAAVDAIDEFAVDDPYCVGWFMENEPTLAGGTEENGRYGIAYAVMRKLIWDSPAKIALIAQLQTKYPTIGSLNSAWGSSFSSWSDFFGPVNLAENSTSARKADFSQFCLSYDKQYFGVLHRCLRNRDQSAMFLGCRFFRFTPEALQAAAGYCDVISFNIYATQLNASWSQYAYLGKPLMVSEFHFGALDSGLFHPGLVATATQAQRGQFFTNYVNTVLDHPLFVGCHWHQYLDEPLTGRVIDGENYNEGFVSVADYPYQTMVQAARSTLSAAYARRWARN